MPRQLRPSPESDSAVTDDLTTVAPAHSNGKNGTPVLLTTAEVAEWDDPFHTPATSPDKLSLLQLSGQLAPDENMTVSILAKALGELRRELEGTRAVLDEEVKTTKTVLAQQVVITSDLVATTNEIKADLKGTRKSVKVVGILLAVLIVVLVLSIIMSLRG